MENPDTVKTFHRKTLFGNTTILEWDMFCQFANWLFGRYDRYEIGVPQRKWDRYFGEIMEGWYCPDIDCLGRIIKTRHKIFCESCKDTFGPTHA